MVKNFKKLVISSAVFAFALMASQTLAGLTGEGFFWETKGQ